MAARKKSETEKAVKPPKAAAASLVQQPELQRAFDAATARMQVGGIGTLRERTLHATLKCWLEPDESRHEIPVGGCVADIFDGEQVTEVQTGSLYPLKKKLAALLPQVPVTVVIPLVHEKWLCWIDPATGESGTPHRSPKKGRFSDVLPELFWIGEGFSTGRLTVRLLLVDIKEYRLQDGWGKEGKSGSHRADRVPLAVAEELWLWESADAHALLPDGLLSPFSAQDFEKATGQHRRSLWQALSFCEESGVIRRAGKDGRRILYEICGEI